MIDGDLSYESVNSAYTITLFYLAQGYTKVGAKDRAASYCAETMRRQYESGNYELKDWCINCISLSEYYYGNCNFA